MTTNGADHHWLPIEAAAIALGVTKKQAYRIARDEKWTTIRGRPREYSYTDIKTTARKRKALTMRKTEMLEKLEAAQAEIDRLTLALSDATAREAERLRAQGAGATRPGITLIAAERDRQIATEGYTPASDAGRVSELIDAGVAYAVAACHENAGTPTAQPLIWPWPPATWKPTGDPARTLTKAGALIAAALDELAAEAHR